MDIDSYRAKRKEENVLNGLDTSSPIYRIFAFDRFCEMLKSKSLCLVKPAKWGDPFENYLLLAEVYTRDGLRVDLGKLRNTIFGQCWSLHNETDAMWRIYSHYKSKNFHDKTKSGIKVKAKTGKIFDRFFETAESSELRCYIGKVDYLEDTEIIANFSASNKAHDILLNDNTGAELPKTLLMKRTEFTHENEVRLIYSTETRDPIVKEETYCFPIDPNELFDEIELDPRLSKSEYQELSEKIRKIGFHNKLSQSNLYKLPFHKIVLDITPGIDSDLLNKFKNNC